MQVRPDVLKMTFHDWITIWTAIEVSLSNIAHFLSVYLRNDPRRIFGEHQKCLWRTGAKSEWFTNFLSQNKLKTIVNFVWVDDSTFLFH